ncbi:type IV pilus assembly protein FimV [Luteimonas sp. MHLX1A]|uniref:type IV pilus assembly protein FimV n=1 Tax=Alterluteimonas muca TaxID=2878684 RepID=UPI001E2D9174|nr:FimV/HubP family polar landmark protein [Luteimonas sp. MHLX1A]MCD9046177.1 ferrous iron transporter B [Luteimonas sp. MHLX1A]
MSRIWQSILLLWLALCVCAPAFALGLGQIQVRSQAGEPLLAEIPVVSSDPAELQQLRARLASPETFARIGLQAPQGAVSDLQFNVALDAQGRPVIRVTTLQPVQEPLLTFLVEVDWGQGRLVREYSALLDAPDTIAAPAQPPIQAPRPAQPTTEGRIVREAEAAAATDAQAATPEPVEPTTAADAAAVPVPAPAAQPATAPVAATAPRAMPGEYGPVQAGDTLSQIVQRIAPDDGVSVNQMMLALLRSNPEAFIGGNINSLRQGAVLRIPAHDEALSISTREATAEVRAQVARWRELSQPAPQPELAAAPADGDADGRTAAAPQPAAQDARLEIVPPGVGGTQQAATRSGISAGGEGDMFRQELQQAQETVAAREAEVEELKARLAELERLQQQQQQLIALKDSELAAAQQRLETSNQQAAAEGAGALPWVLGGLGLLLLGALVFWLLSRRNARQPAFRAPSAASPRVDAPAGPAAPAPVPVAGKPTWHATGAATSTVDAELPPGAVDPRAEAMTASRRAAVTPPAIATAVPTAAGPTGDGEAVADALEDAQGQERIELARAYVELGDIETARTLLQEVVDCGTPAVRGEAAQLLSELA